MVKVRDFCGAVFHPEQYQQFLSGNIQHLETIAMSKSFNTHQMLKQGRLTPEKQPFFYLYMQKYRNHTSIGILAEVAVQDYHENNIKKHEKTLLREGMNHTTYLAEHVGPVVLSHRQDEELNIILRNIVESKPHYASWKTHDQREHTLWKVTTEDADLSKHFERIECLYILDGHHRLEAANKNYVLSDKTRDTDLWIQGLIYSSDYVVVHPQHRVIQSSVEKIQIVKEILTLEHLQVTELEIQDQENFNITSELGQYEVILKLQQKIYGINFKTSSRNTLQMISAHRLQQQIFSELLDSDVLTELQYVPGIICQNELLKHQAIFFVREPAIETIFSIADEGITTPPKSTWFEPKPCSHMVIRLLN